MAMVLMAMSFAIAQPTSPEDSLDIEIDGNKITLEAGDISSLSSVDLNKIIREVVEKTTKIQTQQQLLLKRVDKQLEAGEITEEEAEEMRETIMERTEESMEVIEDLMETWGEAYEDRWEAWADAYEAKMEAWEAEVEAREGNLGAIPPLPPLPPMPMTVPSPNADGMNIPDNSVPADSTKKKKKKIIISDEGIVIEESDSEDDEPFALEFKKGDKDDSPSKKTKKYDRTEDYFDINFGFNQLLEDGQFQVFDGPAEQDIWKSTEFNLGMGGKTRLGSPYSKFYLKWGGEFSWHNFRLRGNNILVKAQENGTTASGAQFINDTSKSYTKSKFEMVYFNIPLMLQLDLSKVGDIDESFTLGIGGYGGVRLSSRRQLEYNDFDGAKVKSKTRNDFFTNPFRYGLMAQLGWKSFKITAKYDLSTYFELDKDFNNNFQMASVTLGFTL